MTGINRLWPDSGVILGVEEFAKKQEEGIEIGYVEYNAPFKCSHCGKKINPKKDRLDGTAALMD